MATVHFTPILGKRIRATALGAAGQVPTSGTAASMLATDGFIRVAVSAEVEDGTEILTKKADGSYCVNEKQANSLKRLNLEVEFCGVNPSLLGLVSNAEGYADYSGDVAGITVAEGPVEKKFAFELWTGIDSNTTVIGAQEASGYLLLPYVNAGVLGDIQADGENAVTFSMTGAYTKGGNSWGVGPYNVMYNAAGLTNEVQTVTITGTPTGGTFTLTYEGQTTTPIAYNATSATVQTALRALSKIGSTGVTVTGGPGPGTPFTITFGGTLAGLNVSQITAAHSFTGGTTPSISTNTTTQGEPSPVALPTALDPLDHLLFILTKLAPPASNDNLQAIP